MLERDFLALTGLSFLADMSLFSHSTIMGTVQHICNRPTQSFTAEVAENAENVEDCDFSAISAVSVVPYHKRGGCVIGAKLAIYSPLS